jgi:hypothetical protein
MNTPIKHQPSSSVIKLAPRILVDCSSKSVINAPFDQIDLPEWVFNQSDAEYQKCSVSHFACGSSHTADGKRMSINVEDVGGLIVQHYVEGVAEKSRCQLISTSEVFVQGDRTTVTVIWEVVVRPISENVCAFENIVLAHTTDDYEEFLQRHGITYEQAKAMLQSAVEAHNAEETPLFAKAIETRSLTAQ